MPEATLALGSNLGDRAGNLRAALGLLEERGVRVLRRSSVWETPPVPADQPPFLNAAVVVDTDLSPPELLAALKRSNGRWDAARSAGGVRGPSTSTSCSTGTGHVVARTYDRHPRIAERAFVLAPLSEVQAAALPVLVKRALELLAALPPEPVIRTGEGL